MDWIIYFDVKELLPEWFLTTFNVSPIKCADYLTMNAQTSYKIQSILQLSDGDNIKSELSFLLCRIQINDDSCTLAVPQLVGQLSLHRISLLYSVHLPQVISNFCQTAWQLVCVSSTGIRPHTVLSTKQNKNLQCPQFHRVYLYM